MKRPASPRSEGGQNGVDPVAGLTWAGRPKYVEYAVILHIGVVERRFEGL